MPPNWRIDLHSQIERQSIRGQTRAHFEDVTQVCYLLIGSTVCHMSRRQLALTANSKFCIQPQLQDNRSSLFNPNILASDILYLDMEFSPNDSFGHVSLVGGRAMSTSQTQELPIPQHLEGESHNGECSDLVHCRGCSCVKGPLNRNEARHPLMDGVMDSDAGADGMIPVQEERSRALGQHDAGTQTSLSDEKDFWTDRIIDLALIPCMWFVFGANFDRFYESLWHTAIRGCVTNATAFALQIVNYKVLLSIRVGQYLGVAVLIKGIAGLASSVVLLINHDESNFGGDFALQLLFVTSNAIIGPCLVLLTAAWYANTNGGCIVRLLLWASSYPVLSSTIDHITVAAGGSYRVYYTICVSLAAVCILLSFYIFACVDMPGVTMWLDNTRQKGRLRDRERWRQTRRSLPLSKLVAEPTAWFIFCASFFGAAGVPVDGDVLQQFYKLVLSEHAKATFLVLLPVAAFGLLVVTNSITCVPVLVLTASLAFAGRMLIVNNSHVETDVYWYTYFYFKLNTGALFLRNFMFYWQYFLWATILFIRSADDAADSQNLVANLVIAFAANALGRVLGYGVLPALTVAADEWSDPAIRVRSVDFFFCAMFVLQIFTLLAWLLWHVWQRLGEGQRKSTEVQLTSAGPDAAAAELEC